MTREYEYSEQIKYSDWPAEWRLDKDDEEQLQVDIDETKEIIRYVQRRIEIGAKSVASKIKKQKRDVRRSNLRERQDSDG